MKSDFKLTVYKKKYDYTYIFGAFPTIEALKNRPSFLAKIVIHEQALHSEKYDIITSLCEQNGVHMEINSKLSERLRDKENCLVIGILYKYQNTLDDTLNHIVLVNPSDMGNMGTIMRTSLGFGVKNLAIIEPAVDYFNPKVLRASMGAIFSLNIRTFPTFQSYLSLCQSKRSFYPFMLDGSMTLQSMSINLNDTYTLIFGNEASGLDPSYQKIGQSIRIHHTTEIDSLNLSVAVGIALSYFQKHIR